MPLQHIHDSCHSNQYVLIITKIITHAGIAAGVGRAFSHVCLSVHLSVL